MQLHEAERELSEFSRQRESFRSVSCVVMLVDGAEIGDKYGVLQLREMDG